MNCRVVSRISHLFLSVAMIMLMGLRVVPHHHYKCGNAELLSLETVHFGFGECSECKHHDCGEEHGNSGEQCRDATLLYYRAAGNDELAVKKLPAPMLFAGLLSQVAITDVPSARQEWYDIHVFRHPSRVLSSFALRGPPVA